MCLILFSYKTHPKYKLILAANRDEFYDRPTTQAGFWADAPNVLAGRDDKAGGTWIGITKTGRLAALTNYRDPQNIDPNAASRGALTSDYLTGTDTPEQYLQKLKESGVHYNGYNLMLGDSDSLFHYNNVNHKIKEVTAGTYGLSNGFFEENWPKLKRGKEDLASLVENENFTQEDLLTILKNRQLALDSDLPQTGIPLDWERSLSPLFIEREDYGTRCSTLILTDYQGIIKFTEKTYQVGGQIESVVDFEL